MHCENIDFGGFKCRGNNLITLVVVLCSKFVNCPKELRANGNPYYHDQLSYECHTTYLYLSSFIVDAYSYDLLLWAWKNRQIVQCSLHCNKSTSSWMFYHFWWHCTICCSVL
jgi:hypothetical protein